MALVIDLRGCVDTLTYVLAYTYVQSYYIRARWCDVV
jgi:hypothetical protein